jgi:nucleoside-diphosphate-sugar epimerase
LARSTDAERTLAALGAEPMRGELGDVESLRAAMKGCRLVVHGAARFRQPGGFDAYRRDNVDGTQNMLAAAKAEGVERFVWIGAAGSLIGGRRIEDADESWPLNEPGYSPYFATKAVADRAVRAANTAGFTTVVVRPGWVWGVGDSGLDGIAEATRAGKMVFIDGGRHRIVTSHVTNTVQGVVLALEKGRGGESYYVFDDGAISIRDFISGALAARGLEAPKKKVPAAVAWIMGSIMEAAWKIFRRPGLPPVTRELVRLNSGPFLVSDAKARRELGYAPLIARDEGFAEMKSRA